MDLKESVLVVIVWWDDLSVCSKIPGGTGPGDEMWLVWGQLNVNLVHQEICWVHQVHNSPSYNCVLI